MKKFTWNTRKACFLICTLTFYTYLCNKTITKQDDSWSCRKKFNASYYTSYVGVDKVRYLELKNSNELNVWNCGLGCGPSSLYQDSSSTYVLWFPGGIQVGDFNVPWLVNHFNNDFNDRKKEDISAFLNLLELKVSNTVDIAKSRLSDLVITNFACEC